MPRNYFPNNDRELMDWLANFASVLDVNKAQVGLVADDVTPISDASDAFGIAYQSYQQQAGLASAASGLRNTKRAEAIEILRPLVRRVNNHPGMTDQLRRLLGLRTPDLAEAPEPITELLPILMLESWPGQVTVHWGPYPGNERINGKPSGVKGANIYRKKAGETAFQLVGFSGSSPYIDYIAGDGADYTYVARYRGTTEADLSKQSEANTVAARGMDLAA
ncbi:MAG: hypothetical protein KBC96_11380 [Armatimonadetes bacterium]|nr:hypothetical protein [Armatimonadota bacterium]